VRCLPVRMGGVKTGLLAGASVAVLSTVVGEAAAQIVVIVGALTAIGWFWSRIVIPAAKTLMRTLAAVGALENLGEFMDDTRASVKDAETAARAAAQKADRLDERMTDRLDLLERHVGLFAAEDAARIRQAMREGPPDVERRKSA
jgi:hypothetical protein